MTRGRRRWLVPEVLQSSLMDCGPAALSAVCEGFGISISYDELRERCATDVDGTSIDALAALAAEYGLRSQQILISVESFLLAESNALPAIVITSEGGGLHFIVVWRRVGSWVQVLDPGSGRRWLHRSQLLRKLPSLPTRISRVRFRRWAESENARAPLRARLRALGLSGAHAGTLVERALRDASWRGFATLDAGTRMLEALVASGACGRGRQARRLLEAACAARGSAAAGASPEERAIPQRFFWVSEQPGSDALLVQGTVVIRFTGLAPAVQAARQRAPVRAAAAPSHEPSELAPQVPPLAREPGGSARPPSSCAALAGWPEPVLAVLAAPRLEPLRVLAQLAWHESPARCLWSLLCAALGAALVPLEALALRGLLGLDVASSLPYQRALGLAGLLVLVGLGAWLERWLLGALAQLGRVLEMRLRVAFLLALPRLDDNYTRTRPTSDLAARGAALHVLREVPSLWAGVLGGLLTVLTTSAALAWLQPEGMALALPLAVVASCVPLLARKALTEASLRLRTHGAALDRFYLDALIGVSPVRVHGAEQSVANEHEQLLGEWARTARALDHHGLGVQGLQLALGTLLTGLLVLACASEPGGASRLLLIVFLGGRLTGEAARVASSELALRRSRAAGLRLLSPLQAAPADVFVTEPAASPRPARGARVRWEGVSVSAGGHRLLEKVSLDVPAGSHVAVVGPSGSGKSSLLGSVLGWWQPAEGRVLVDEEELSRGRLAQLRAEVAWIDPGLQLFSGSLLGNLRYAEDRAPRERLPRVLEAARLREVLERLPQGMMTELGESGVRLSGGQGQRVRLGRALLQSAPRLVLLDEAFRGLPREQRRELLARVRSWYARSTLIFVSHDIEDAIGFERVVVIEQGRIVEDGPPQLLLANAQGQLSALLREQQRLAQVLWGGAFWRRARLEHGKLVEGA